MKAATTLRPVELWLVFNGQLRVLGRQGKVRFAKKRNVVLVGGRARAVGTELLAGNNWFDPEGHKPGTLSEDLASGGRRSIGWQGPGCEATRVLPLGMGVAWATIGCHAAGACECEVFAPGGWHWTISRLVKMHPSEYLEIEPGPVGVVSKR